MSLIITDECINCDVCEPECPNEAIVMGEEHYVIRQGRCTECVGVHDEPQCRRLCPIEGCIVVNAARGETRAQLERKAARLKLGRGLDELIAQRGGNL